MGRPASPGARPVSSPRYPQPGSAPRRRARMRRSASTSASALSPPPRAPPARWKSRRRISPAASAASRAASRGRRQSMGRPDSSRGYDSAPGGPVMREKWRTWGVAALSFVAAVAAPGGERDPRTRLHEVLDQRREAFAQVAREIWGFAEVGYQEEKSSALLQSQLKGAGFEVRSGVAGIPTAFVASWGEGRPVVALLAEFDALPGLSQAAVPERKAVVEGAPGHGCGHHLLGTASVADYNGANNGTTLANISAKFRFRVVATCSPTSTSPRSCSAISRRPAVWSTARRSRRSPSGSAARSATRRRRWARRRR